MITIFRNLKINFSNKFKLMSLSSLIIIFFGFAIYFFKGLEIGTEFAGGIELTLESGSQSISSQKVQKFLDDNGYQYSKISTHINKSGEKQIEVIMPYSEYQWLGNICSDKKFVEEEECRAGFTEKYFKNQLEEEKSGFILMNFYKNNPEKGLEQQSLAIQAVMIAIVLIGFYIIIRFDWYSAIGGIAAIIHDILIVMSALIFFDYTFEPYIVAALLIIIGYSLNDTIVVFDRMRENIKEYTNMELIDIINLSLNETLSRTVITSLTTFMVVIAAFIFGAPDLKPASFCLIIGVISGTYSSIFMATPIMMFLRKKYYKEPNEKEEQWQ